MIDVAEGELDRASSRLDRALAIREREGPDHPHVAYTFDVLAELALARGEPQRAVPWARRAVEVREAGHAGPVLTGASRFLLARALAEDPETSAPDREHAVELARTAVAELAEGPPQERLAVERWLRLVAAHDDSG